MGNKSKKNQSKPNYRVVAKWDGEMGEDQAFELVFSPDPLKISTDIRKHLVLLANTFSAGTRQLMSLISQLPQPTEEELVNYTYDFGLHGEEYGEGLFALYNYKKALMEEFVSIIERVLPDAFHDVLYVKGAQEKIFDQIRKEKFEKDAELHNKDVTVDVKEKKEEVN